MLSFWVYSFLLFPWCFRKKGYSRHVLSLPLLTRNLYKNVLTGSSFSPVLRPNTLPRLSREAATSHPYVLTLLSPATGPLHVLLSLPGVLSPHILPA